MSKTPATGSAADLTVRRSITLICPEQLSPNPKNARKHNTVQVRAIAKSIQAFGFNAPILINRDWQIIAGHGRYEAALLLKLDQIPVIFLDHLTEAQAKAYALADNRLTDRSAWDDNLVATQLKELSELVLDFDIDATGFELPEIDFRIQSLEQTDGIGRLDDFNQADGEPTSALGDIWYLGTHRLLCGDSLDPVARGNLFAGEKASATFTDPPYNVRVDGHVSGKGSVHHREFPMATGEMSQSEFEAFLTSALSGICEHTRPGALVYICMDWRHVREITGAGASCNCPLLNVCVWVKANSGMGSLYRSHHEFVFVFKNGPQSHLNNVQLGRFGRNRTNVWNYAGSNAFPRKGSDRNLDLHPTVKPFLLVVDAIRDCTNRNDILFDPFIGSGTTILAAEYTGRRCYGIELDPLYIDTAVERWQLMTGHKAHNQLGETFDIVKKARGGSRD